MNAPDLPKAPAEAPGSGSDDAYRPAAGAPASTLRAPGASGFGQAKTSPAGGIDVEDLAPVMAQDGSALPLDLWTGLDQTAVERLIAALDIPPHSAALHDLWQRLILSGATPPAGNKGAASFAALRLEALYRSGLAAEAGKAVAHQGAGAEAPDAVLALLSARNELASARRDKACELAGQSTALKGAVPKHVRAEAILLNGYCAATAGDTSGAALAAELAREEGLDATPGLAALDALSIKAKPAAKIDGKLTLLDYRLLEIAGAPPGLDALAKAEPALLVALANDAESKPDIRLAAAEAAARLNALPADALAALYSALGQNVPAATLLASAQTSSVQFRAAAFRAIETEKNAKTKTALIRALIASARQAGFGYQAMRLVARTTKQIEPVPGLSDFTDTAAQIGLASGNLDLARAWLARTAATNAWQSLLAIADPAAQPSQEDFAALEMLAARNRFTPETLHRLVTVLDALGYLVPIPLWDRANGSPQPTAGYLPETGVLPALQQASLKKEFGHTVLLVMKTLGPDGPEGANLIALGDSIRALKRAGLDADAKRMGVEALLAHWPSSGNTQDARLEPPRAP